LRDPLRLMRIRELATILLAAAVTLACSGEVATIPSIELPTIDTAALEQQVDAALAEVGNLTENPPEIELPAELAALLADHDIQLPPVPSNAQEICEVMRFPGASTVTGAGLGAAIEMLAGLEVGLVVGLLVTVVFRTCPDWSPHLVEAVEELLATPR
jgi:hypothetical protein